MCEYSITFHCPTYEVFRDVLNSLDEIAKKREQAKKKDRRGQFIKEAHRRTKEFYQEHSFNIPYNESFKIVCEQMRDERETMEEEILQEVRDMSGGTVV